MENILYEMLLENENLDGVFAISLVDSPAIEQEFIMLSKEDKNRILINLEKGDIKRHVLTGPALIPNIIIPRKGYSITFSKETIRKISENFLIQNKQNNVDLQHQLNVNDVYLIESWIVEDESNDKIYTLGYTKEQVPQGSWCVSFKIKNKDLWDEYLASGILKGFSISGSFSEKEIQMNNNIDDDIRDIALALIYHPKFIDSKYEWKMKPDSDKVKNCPVCKERNGQVHTLREWITIGIPGVPENTEVAGMLTKYNTSPYSTYCEDACNCKLVRVSEPSDIKPIKRGIIDIKLPWTDKYKSK